MPADGEAKVQYTTDGGSTWSNFDFNTAEHIRSKRKIIEELKFSVGKGDISNLSGGLTVRLQLYDKSSGTWSTWFKGETQSAGDIKQDGTVEVTARGGGHKASTEKYDITGMSNTDNWAVLEESFSGSPIDPATTSWSIEPSQDEDTFPSTLYSISSYSSKGKRSRVWHEMTQQYDWALYLETEDQEIRYEPNGYYSSGETIDTSSKATKMTSWEDEIVNERTLVNKVIINYKDSNDNVQEVEEKDSTSIDNYGEYMIRRSIPYITTSTEASDIAGQLLSPNPGTEGKVETYLYKSNLVNETVWIKDSPRNIDGDFVVKEQRNYYPERRTVLKVGDIDKRMTIGAREGIEHRQERSEMLDKRTSDDVGGQGLEVDHGDRNTSGDTTVQHGDRNTSGNTDASDILDYLSRSENTHPHDVGSETTQTYTLASIQGSDSNSSLSLSSGWTNSALSVSVGGTFTFLYCYVRVNANFNDNVDFTMKLNNPSGNEDIKYRTGSLYSSGPHVKQMFVMPILKSLTGSVDLDIYVDTGGDYDCELVVYSADESHSHDIPSATDRAQGNKSNTTLSTDSDSKSTSGSTDSYQSETANTSGSTDSNQTESTTTDTGVTIEVPEEKETDR